MQAQPGSRSHRFHLLLSFLIVLSLPHLIGAESILGDNNTCDNAHILERNADCDPQRATMTWNTTKETTANTSAKMYGYRYPQVPLEVDNYPVGPEGLQLEQVHVYVRHGERTPVGVRLTDPPASIPEYWMMCKTARRFRAAVSSALGPSPNQAPHLSVGNDGLEETLQTQKVVERKDGTLGEGECLLGELTDLGRQSTYSFGQNLRRLYVERLGFIPDTLPSSDIVYFRSTNMPRTIESLQQVVHGLYPTNKCLDGAQPPLRIRNGKDENLIGNTYACKRLEILQAGFANAAAQAYNRSLERLDKKVSKYLNGNPIRVDGKPRASGIMDTIRASIAHGIKVPQEFEDKTIVDVIEQAVVSEWYSDKTEEVRRLAMGRLLDDMSRKMQTKIQQREADPLKILVHSTHDTAIAGLCSTFDVFDDKWPAFTASITFELFKAREPESDQTRSQSILTRMGSPSSSSQYYVRMRHQNKDMTLPICAQSGNHLEGHPEFCTFSAFKARVKELTPTEWDDECLPAGKP